MAFRDDFITDLNASPAPAPTPVPTPDLPKWDGKIFVRRVASGVVQNFYRRFAADGADTRAAATAWFACDAAGNRIFNDDDVLWLSQTAAMGPTNERIYAAACFVNGLTVENREGWRKNFESTAGSGSPCSSAAPSTPASASTSAAS
jgi:hypothetical protein